RTAPIGARATPKRPWSRRRDGCPDKRPRSCRAATGRNRASGSIRGARLGDRALRRSRLALLVGDQSEERFARDAQAFRGLSRERRGRDARDEAVGRILVLVELDPQELEPGQRTVAREIRGEAQKVSGDERLRLEL